MADEPSAVPKAHLRNHGLLSIANTASCLSHVNGGFSYQRRCSWRLVLLTFSTASYGLCLPRTRTEKSMPDVLIEVRGDWLEGRKADFIEAVEEGIVAALRTPKEDKILRLVEHSLDNFSIPSWAGERFTHIEITMFRGRSIEVKRDLYRSIVKNLEPFGVPPNDVKIILIEVSPSDVGMRGGRAASDLELGYEVAI